MVSFESLFDPCQFEFARMELDRVDSSHEGQDEPLFCCELNLFHTPQPKRNALSQRRDKAFLIFCLIHQSAGIFF